MMTKDEAKRHLQAAKIMLLGKDGQPISDLYEAICVALDAIDAIEAAEQKIAELERILKAVQENSGINFRLWQEAEAQLPKEGAWIRITEHNYKCSACAAWFVVDDDDELKEFHYCPNCGAKMDGETEHGNTYSLGKIEMPKGVMEQIIAYGERKDGESDA